MITQEELKRLLHYNPETGFFTWLVTNTNKVKVGSVAGTRNPEAYCQITVAGGRYLAHRLVWLYVHGRWPTEMLDHKNLNRQDNRLENLREATRSENLSNSKCRSHSKIGVKGVCKNGGRWMARITVGGESTYLGTFDTIEEAHQAFMAAARAQRGEFARAA